MQLGKTTQVTGRFSCPFCRGADGLERDDIEVPVEKKYPTPIPLENQVGWPLYKTAFLYSSYVSWFCIFGRIGWTLDFLEVAFLMYLTLLQGLVCDFLVFLVGLF